MMYTAFFKKTTVFVVVGLLSTTLFRSACPATVGNYVEMVSALASIPFQARANHFDIVGKKQPALTMHIAADTMSIINKILFFYNNSDARGGVQFERDTVVNGAVMAGEMTRLYRHINDYVYPSVGNLSKPPRLEAQDSDDQDVAGDIEAQLAYGARILTLPMLKALSAFGLAVAQEKENFADRKKFIYVMTAANSLSYLMEEYTQLSLNSRHKKSSDYKQMVGALIFINATWLTYELKNVMFPHQTHDTPPVGFANIPGVTLVKGDITNQVFKDQAHAAIVNAANTEMLGGGGIDGAIHRAAGQGLFQECLNVKAINGQRCPIGQARITGGHNLGQLRIIHTVGPNTHIREQNENKAELLAAAYENSLMVARDNGIRYVALPSISTAIYGYPIAEASTIAVDTVINFMHFNPQAFDEVRFVTFSDHDYGVYNTTLGKKDQI